MVPTNTTPEQIIGENFDIYYQHLEGFQKSGISWNEYANRSKLSPTTRKEFAKILNDLHSYGFYGPEAINDKIEVYTMTQKPKVNNDKVQQTAQESAHCGSIY